MAPTAEAAEIKSLLDQIDAVKADNEKLQAEIDSASSTAAASSGDQFKTAAELAGVTTGDVDEATLKKASDFVNYKDSAKSYDKARDPLGDDVRTRLFRWRSSLLTCEIAP